MFSEAPEELKRSVMGLVALAIRANRFARIDSRESFAIETPIFIFIAREADSHESLEFPIRANHATKLLYSALHFLDNICSQRRPRKRKDLFWVPMAL